MRRRTAQRRPAPTGLPLAGWLFADMLLVLALVAMGDQGDPLAAAGTAGPAAGPSASATGQSPSPAPSPSSTGPRGVEHDPVVIQVSGDGDRAADQVRAETEPYRDRQAAVVLTFGSNRDPAAGQAYAHTVNAVLDRARPEMFHDTTTRDFISLEDNPGHASLEIYFYTR
ncbi:hypothetical protein [Kitasatospora sp. NPDC059571]|uniref:hypothetical protein n=1 Tax=Kitasatospora sp. NPDC059571 TaxID=3346871 RepID=UPI0036CDEB24